MQTPSWTPDHARALADAAPEVPVANRLEVERAWTTVRREIGQTGRPRGRRRTRVVLISGLAAATLAVGGVATATVYHAATGRYPSDAEDLRLGGPGEYLDPAASDFGQEVTERTRDIPFPSDEAREIARLWQVHDGQRDDPGIGVTSTGGMRASVARSAICSWSNEWAAAVKAGDPQAKARAKEMLDQASTWPAVTDIDSEQEVRTKKIEIRATASPSTSAKPEAELPAPVAGSIPAGSAVVDDSTPFGYLSAVRAAARGDSITKLTKALNTADCDAALTPNLPDPYAELRRR